METILLNLLQTLKQERVPHADAELAAAAGMELQQVGHYIRELRDYGYGISMVPHCGWRLDKDTDTPYSHEVQPLLKTTAYGRAYHFFPLLDSTNLKATRWVHEGAPAGACVVADAQTRGRGRAERRWQSPPGKNIYLSLIYRPHCLTQLELPQLSLIAGITLTETLHSSFPMLKVKVKWPNDVMLQNRKLAGILTESIAASESGRAVIIGIGINVNAQTKMLLDDESRRRAVSLFDVLSTEVARPKLIADFLNHLEPNIQHWQSQGFAPFEAIWNQYDFLKNRPVTLRNGMQVITGTARGITASGHLLLERQDGRLHRIHSGDVHLLDY